MSNQILFEGKQYVSTSEASAVSGLSRDYIARLCKKRAIIGQRVGVNWYVDLSSVQALLVAQQHAREHRRQGLVQERTEEYQAKHRERLTRLSDATRTDAPAPVVAVEIPQRVRPQERVSAPRAGWVYDRMRHAVESQTGGNMDVVVRPDRLVIEPPNRESNVSVSARQRSRELRERVTALTLALVCTFGAYAFINPVSVGVAADSVRGEAISLQNGYRDLADGGARALAVRTETQVAAAAENPGTAFAALYGAVVDQTQIEVETLATNVGARVSDALYAVATRIDAVARHSATRQSSIAAVNISPHPTASSGVQSSERLAAAPLLLTSPYGAAAESSMAQTGAVGVVGTASATALGALATAVKFSGTQVAYGDIVAYNPSTDTYALTNGSNDPNAYGVVVESPALLYRPDNAASVPVARSGSALVNVTLENGAIRLGDPLTSSSIPGKARRANAGENVIGTAAEAFDGTQGVPLKAPNGTEEISGTIAVNVDVGGGSSGATTAQCSSFWCALSSVLNPVLVRTFIRYLLAALIAVLSLTFAFRSFMSDANYGVISMGRNPRAKSSIQSMVLLNALLALVISSVGLFAAMVVLFATA